MTLSHGQGFASRETGQIITINPVGLFIRVNYLVRGSTIVALTYLKSRDELNLQVDLLNKGME